MDACAVNMVNGFNSRLLSVKKLFVTSVVFALFQGFMPIIGYFIGSLFGEVVNDAAAYIAFVLLVFIGLSMLFESKIQKQDINFKTIVSQGIATSVDALAIGISFRALDVNLWFACPMIILITFTLSLLGYILGNKFSKLFDNGLRKAGGIVLIIMGIEILLTHLFF